MDRLVEICLEEIALEGLDGITIETFWMRLQNRDPAFPLALDDHSRPMIWQHVSVCEEVEFFELPEPRDMPIPRDKLEGTNPLTGAVSSTVERKYVKDIYPIVYVEDKEKDVRGSCPTYYQRKDVTKEVRDADGNVKMSLVELDKRWGTKLVMVASQDLRWKALVGQHGDPEFELREKQYVMVECICRGRHLGEWQWKLAKLLQSDTKNMFYQRKTLQRGGFIKKRMAIYQVDDRPHNRAVLLFGSSFKEHVAMPMYYTLWQAISDLLEKRPNRTWSLVALRCALRERFSDLQITDKIFKRVFGAAQTAKMVSKVRLTHEQVFNERKTTKAHPDCDRMVLAVQLLKTYDEYINEDNMDDEDDEEDKTDSRYFGDPQENVMVAERNLKTQIVNLIEERQESGQCIPQRGVKHSLMIDYYISRFIMRRLRSEKIATQIMTDEGRQRTAVYCLTNSVERVQEILKNKQTTELLKNMQGKDGTDTPGSSSTPAGSRPDSPFQDIAGASSSPHLPATDGSSTITIKQECDEEAVVPNIAYGVKGTTTKTSNYLRRRKFVLDFMQSNKVVEGTCPITKALRAEERRIGSTVTCDNKTVRRLVAKLCEENQLQTISTVVMSDDGLHSKTVTLVTLYGIKPVDHVVTSALQVAKFRFFATSKVPHRKKTPTKPTVENIEVPHQKSAETKSKKEHNRPKKKHGDKEKKSESKTPKKAKHKLEENKKENKEEEKKKMPDAVPTEAPQKPAQSEDNPFGSRRQHYYKQLGYLPKMPRMRAAHKFMWYMVYGHSKQAIRTETLEEIEKMKGAVPEDAGSDSEQKGQRRKKSPRKRAAKATADTPEPMSPGKKVGGKNQAEVDEGNSLPAIPISIRKLEDECMDVQEESLDGVCSAVDNVNSEAKGATGVSSELDTASQERENSNAIAQDNMLGVNNAEQDSSTLQSTAQSVSVPDDTNQSQQALEEGDQSGTAAVRTDQSEHRLESRHSDESKQSDRTQTEINQSLQSTAQTSQSNGSGSGGADVTQDDVLLLQDEPTDPQQHRTSASNELGFTVYCDTYDWRRYVPPLPFDEKRPEGWCVVRDLLLSMPLSVFLKIISLPIEIKGVKEFVDHPLKKHILMRHIPMWIRRQLLRGRRYLFNLEDVMIKLASIGLAVLSSSENVEKDKLEVFVCRKASILDTTTSKPDIRKISDQQRYLRRFYELNQPEDLDAYWFDLRCICLDTPLGFSKERGLTRKRGQSDRYERNIKAIAQQVPDMSHPVKDTGLPPGDGRGAGGLDSSFFAHMRRNWNWYCVIPEWTYDRYTAMYQHEDNSGKEEENNQRGKSKLKRLGSIQYRRSNMSKGTTVEVVSINKDVRKDMQPTLKRKRPVEGDANQNDSPPPKTKKQVIKEKNKESKDQHKEAKKKDAEIQKERNERRKFRKSRNETGQRNTKTYDDIDEEARNQMSKMRVEWSAEEDSLILLCRVASSILNIKARKLGTFVPWYVIRDLLHKNIERSKDKTTVSLAKRSHHILKNKYTFLNYKICLAEAQADKELMQEFKELSGDYSMTKVCASEYERLVVRLQQKFQNSECSGGALNDLKELNNYIVTPVHQYVPLDDTTLAEKDVKSVKDIHYKLLQSLVLSSLASRDSALYNNQILYKTYEQYDQDLLRDVFFHIKKLGFCNRNRKFPLAPNRVIPLAPISIQLSHSYKERFATNVPETVFNEIQGLFERLQTSDEPLALPTEVNGGDCACFLSLLAANMINFDVTLPDQIIVLDTNLFIGDPVVNESDSDSDSDNEGGGESVAKAKSTKLSKDSHADIQELIRIQEERQKIVAENQQKQKAIQESMEADEELPDAGEDSDVNTLCESVSADHSYSLSHKTLPSDGGESSGHSKDEAGAETSTAVSHTERTHKEQTDSASSEKLAWDKKPSQETTSLGESNPLSKGYDIQAAQISHSKWLILQGHFSPGVCGQGWTNIQDSTVVNACTVTLLKGNQVRSGALWEISKDAGSRTITDSTQDRTQITKAHTLLWDFVTQDNGDFAGFMSNCQKTSQIFGRDDFLTSKWSDVGEMIDGLNLRWPENDLKALRTIHNCIEEGGNMGICCSEFRKKSLLEGSTKTMSECLQILIHEGLVLEVGFDTLRYVATKNASHWLTHSIRRLRQTETVDPSSTTTAPNKRQRTEPNVIDISKDEDDDCIIISDDDEENRESHPEREVKKGRKRRRRRSTETKQTGPSDATANVDGEEANTSGKRKRAPSPTEWQGTPIKFIGKPWWSIEGFQSDSELQKYLQHVLLLVVSKPGIKEHSLFEHYKDILHPVECLELLKMLSEIGCITRHTVYQLKPTTIFEMPRRQDTTKPLYFYQPSVDGLIRLNQYCKAHVQPQN